MNKLASRLFITKKAVIGNDAFGNPVEIDGAFLNFWGRNLPLIIAAVVAGIFIVVRIS